MHMVAYLREWISLSMQKCLLKVTEALMNVDWIKWMYFCVNEFEVGVNDIFSGNEQQKMYLLHL